MSTLVNNSLLLLKMILLFIVLCLLGCSPKTSKYLGLAWEQSLSVFGEKDLDHYPNRVPRSDTRFQFDQQRRSKIKRSDSCFYVSEAVFICKYKDQKYQAIKRKYNELQQIDASDNKLVYIFTYSDQMRKGYAYFSQFVNPLIYDYSDSQTEITDGIPVPLIDINDYYDLNHEDVKGFTHVVIDSQSGEPDFNIHLYEAEYLPDQWKHGFSKGISFHDKMNIVAYWFIAW